MIRCIAAAAILGASAIAAPASAIGVYSFSGPIGSFTFFSPGLLTGNVDASVYDLVECRSSVVSCDSVSLLTNTSVFGNTDQFDAAIFHYDGGGSSFFYFDNGAFDAPGTYKDINSNHYITVGDVRLSGRTNYRFNGPIGDFELKAQEPITGIVGATARQARCALTAATCTGVTVAGDLGYATDPYDSTAIQYDGGGSSYFYFPNYAFQVPGTYSDINSPQNTITVTAAVPEPASWALLIAGFGLTGAAARRRRVATVA